MPSHTCPNCARINPSQATFCYFDGVALQAQRAPVSVGLQSFSKPFTFASGKACQNFDQLALGCQTHWAAATDALVQGYLEKFLAGQGRADLALAAREAARFPDKDRGLDLFLARLPSQAVKEPKLVVQPSELNFGRLKIGENKTIPLQMHNQGMRIIYGSVTVENAPWLSLGSGTQQKLFQFGSDLSIPVNISGKRLRASNKPLEGRLIVQSNAGLFTIPVRADVPVKPFPSGSLANARSPRQIAERAKADPKNAAPLFEKGTVAAWYKDNGWQYPVKGQSASGLGAVQQFFEALGLTPPPKVEVSERAVALKGRAGEALPPFQLEVKAHEKRPVYAHATTDQPWLEVGRARLNGRVATIPLTVGNVPARDGETLKAHVTITANGNQRFVVPVTLAVDGNFKFMPAAAATVTAPMLLARPGGAPRGKAVNLLPMALMLLCLFGVLVWDLLPAGGETTVCFPPEGGGPDDTRAALLQPYDNENRIAVLFAEETQRFGISVLRLHDPRYPEKPKLLTRNERGNTNNTVVRIEGHDYVFGRESAGNGVRWAREKNKVLKEVYSADKRRCYSVMVYETERIRVTQTVQIMVGEGTRLYDTALVKYEVSNMDKKTHTVGLRAMIDTYIGAEDGPPFLIPPTEDNPKELLVDGKIVLEKERIPQFMRVLENGNPDDRNATVAEMGLKLKGFEPINKLVVCRWPQEWGGSEARWDWPATAMNQPPEKEKDSCVALYWSTITMNPGEKRTMGYCFGLGRIAREVDDISGSNSQGKLRLYPPQTLGVAGDAFVMTAYFRNADGQTCTLKLPPGMRFADRESAEKAVKTEPGKEYAVATWRVIGSAPVEYTMEAVLSGGASSKAKVKVPKDSLFR
ncbi:MAG: hypothetical protein K2R98_25050 [Gemmataceae bacterium]|nr:hypothetical protein [Gemmataceae bacterium]